MIKPSEMGLLKAAISCLVEKRARQEMAHLLWVDKKISNEKYIESVMEFSVMEDQVNALVDMLDLGSLFPMKSLKKPCQSIQIVCVSPPGMPKNRAIAGDAMPNRQAKQKEKDDA